jgi:hypothetical protein
MFVVFKIKKYWRHKIIKTQQAYALVLNNCLKNNKIVLKTIAVWE